MAFTGKETRGCLQPPWAHREFHYNVFTSLEEKGKKKFRGIRLKVLLLVTYMNEESYCLWLSVGLRYGTRQDVVRYDTEQKSTDFSQS